MNPTISALLGVQHGLVLRRQLQAAGYESVWIDRAVRNGDWVAVRRGVYMPAARWAELDEWHGQPLARALAASHAMTRPHVLSHDSAALAAGMSVLRARPELVHITRRGHLGGRMANTVKHHQAPYRPGQVLALGSVGYLEPARTAADIAREHGFVHGAVAFDAAYRTGATASAMATAVDAMKNWPGVTTVRAALAAADPGAESPGETLARLILVGLGAGSVQTQFGLHRDGRTVWCDLRVGRHIVEFDGHTKYLPPSLGGVSSRAAHDVVLEEKRREDFIRSFRLGVSRLDWESVLPHNWTSTGRRLLRAISESDRLFGRDLSDLDPFRVRVPRVA